MNEDDMPTEEELTKMASYVDNFIMDFCNEHRIGPLEVTGLILARLARMSKEFGYNEQFNNLLTEIAYVSSTQTLESNNSTSVH